jgi:CspA family cold shock protein
MTIKQVTLSFAVAAVLALTASLASLTQHLPAPLAYFSIALLAACLVLLLSNRGTAPVSVANAQVKVQARALAGAHEQGTVKWFSANKGFGFITRDNGDDIFVHFRSINTKGNRVLREGQRVKFTVGTGSKGLQAEDVTALP